MVPKSPSDVADDILNDRLPSVAWLDSQWLPSAPGATSGRRPRFGHGNPSFPTLLDPAPLLALEQQEAATLPPWTVPTVQTVPHQEPGADRTPGNPPRRALPLRVLPARAGISGARLASLR
jgi:hypothetical protein